MTEAPMRDITDAERQAFEEDGVVHLPGFFNREWVEMLRDRAADAMANPGKMAQELAQGTEVGRFFAETFLWHRDNAFERFVQASPAAAMAAQVMRSDRMNIVFDQFLIK